MKSRQLSITIDKSNLKFLDEMKSEQKKSRSEIIDSIISTYKRYRLRRDVEHGFQAQDSDDSDLAMEDFSDYLSIIEDDEK